MQAIEDKKSIAIGMIVLVKENGSIISSLLTNWTVHVVVTTLTSIDTASKERDKLENMLRYSYHILLKSVSRPYIHRACCTFGKTVTAASYYN